jgi:hypothetical protein
VAVAGLLLIGASMVTYSLTRFGGGALEGFADLTFDRFNFWHCPYEGCGSARVFQFGLGITIVGAVFAYRYDSTLGAVLRWVRHGRDEPKR